MAFSKTPTFQVQAPGSPIEFIAGRLVVFPDDAVVDFSGSCVRISGNLYLTAKHLIEDYMEKYGSNAGVLKLDFWIVHVLPGPEYEIWRVDRSWLSLVSDLAILHVIPFNDVAGRSIARYCARLSLRPPPVGSRVVGFGYHGCTGTVKKDEGGTRHIEINGRGATTVGEVQEIHSPFRDPIRLNFPCFRVNARFDGGMSGGPVVNDQGHVCGIICSNLPPDEPNAEHTSYAATLWPAMAIPMNLGDDGISTVAWYPAVKFAGKGIIHAIDYERVYFLDPTRSETAAFRED